jgi:hypothetical protein
MRMPRGSFAGELMRKPTAYESGAFPARSIRDQPAAVIKDNLAAQEIKLQ